MSKLKNSQLIAAPLDQVWAVLKDVGGVHRFHPKVERSPLSSAQREGVGAARVCHFYDGTSIHEEVIAWEEGRRLVVRLSDFSMPIERGEAEMQCRAVDAGTTEVTISMDYDMKFGPLGAVMNALMMRPMMTRMFGQVLDGLEHHLTTGEHIGRDGERVPVAMAA